MNSDKIFKAIADPTRRQILDLLNKKNAPETISSISLNFSATRQAVSKHIMILRSAGLVSLKRKGREQICSAKPSALKDVFNWVEKYNSFWNKKLISLENYLDKN